MQHTSKSRAWSGAEYFRRAYPTSTLVEVKSLVSPDLMIEIEAMAVIAA
jgi:enamine deaminase RidA (YjgF/YER057c/UK114 family)